ncbi:MAG: hypothetical protein M1361_01845 [Patescibacteria group bacterium]|nr:hypothetical protein [Patescibacteria group bacterium]MCL5224331.1 hypothetical protein [Patescibacteria group bacterium]
MKRLKSLLVVWLEILVGGLILIFVPDIRWFLFYLLVIVLMTSVMRADYLRKVVRVFQVENGVNLASIAKKLNISEAEIQKSRDDLSDSLLDDQRKSLHKDMEELGISSPERFYRNPVDGLSDTERGKKFMDKVFKDFGDN